MHKLLILLVCLMLFTGCGTIMNLSTPNPTTYGGVKKDAQLMVEGIYGKIDRSRVQHVYVYSTMIFLPDVIFRVICLTDLILSGFGDTIALLARPAEPDSIESTPPPASE